MLWLNSLLEVLGAATTALKQVCAAQLLDVCRMYERTESSAEQQ